MKLILPKNVKRIITRLKEAGFLAYAVGGCVRDSILNRKPKDWDIKHVVVDNEVFLYYKLPKLTVALIKGTAADK
ncbi:MAG: hypothetical protein J6M24_06540 [Lachnospiraceae bacterium]|nr:hypothetical protein [Lachnospiraceae bacterium]